jgi:hypothetical protein
MFRLFSQYELERILGVFGMSRAKRRHGALKGWVFCHCGFFTQN